MSTHQNTVGFTTLLRPFAYAKRWASGKAWWDGAGEGLPASGGRGIGNGIGGSAFEGTECLFVVLTV